MRFDRIGLAFGLMVAGCTRGLAAPSSPPPVPVEIASVQTAKLRDSSEYVSMLKSRRSVRVQPQVDGWVTDIRVHSGDRVEPGSVLMSIDSRRQQAAVRSEQANRAARLADLDYWRQQRARIARLYAGGGASRQELDAAETSLASAQAAVVAQEAQVRSQAVQLRYYRVTAPEAGAVGDIPVRIGDLVTPQTLLTTIDQNERLEVYVEVPVAQASQVRLGTPLEVLDERGKLLTTATVSFISPQVTPQQTVLVKGWVDNQARQLRNAQVVRARVIFGEHQGPVVPVLSVLIRNGQAFVWTVKDGPGGAVAEQRVIQVGQITGQSYPVLHGLRAGDRIVVSGIQKLRPGARVTAAAPAPQKAM